MAELGERVAKLEAYTDATKARLEKIEFIVQDIHDDMHAAKASGRMVLYIAIAVGTVFGYLGSWVVHWVKG